MELKKEHEYRNAMERIDYLMAKGSAHVTDDELIEIEKLAKAVQAFEQEKFKLTPNS